MDANLYEDSVLYKALFDASQGRIGPRDADDLEIWEIATLLGVSEPNDASSDDSVVRSASPSTSSRARLRQRVAHARGLAPKPEAQAMSQTAFSQLTKALA